MHFSWPLAVWLMKTHVITIWQHGLALITAQDSTSPTLNMIFYDHYFYWVLRFSIFVAKVQHCWRVEQFSGWFQLSSFAPPNTLQKFLLDKVPEITTYYCKDKESHEIWQAMGLSLSSSYPFFLLLSLPLALAFRDGCSPRAAPALLSPHSFTPLHWCMLELITRTPSLILSYSSLLSRSPLLPNWQRAKGCHRSVCASTKFKVLAVC